MTCKTQRLINYSKPKPKADFTTNYAPLKEWQQKNLLGEKLEISVTPEEIRAVCCRRCFNAKKPRCKCKCHKVFHGKGNLTPSSNEANIKRCSKSNRCANYKLGKCLEECNDFTEKLTASLVF